MIVLSRFFSTLGRGLWDSLRVFDGFDDWSHLVLIISEGHRRLLHYDVPGIGEALNDI